MRTTKTRRPTLGYMDEAEASSNSTRKTMCRRVQECLELLVLDRPLFENLQLPIVFND